MGQARKASATGKRGARAAMVEGRSRAPHGADAVVGLSPREHMDAVPDGEGLGDGSLVPLMRPINACETDTRFAFKGRSSA